MTNFFNTSVRRFASAIANEMLGLWALRGILASIAIGMVSVLSIQSARAGCGDYVILRGETALKAPHGSMPNKVLPFALTGASQKIPMAPAVPCEGMSCQRNEKLGNATPPPVQRLVSSMSWSRISDVRFAIPEGESLFMMHSDAFVQAGFPAGIFKPPRLGCRD